MKPAFILLISYIFTLLLLSGCPAEKPPQVAVPSATPTPLSTPQPTPEPTPIPRAAQLIAAPRIRFQLLPDFAPAALNNYDAVAGTQTRPDSGAGRGTDISVLSYAVVWSHSRVRRLKFEGASAQTAESINDNGDVLGTVSTTSLFPGGDRSAIALWPASGQSETYGNAGLAWAGRLNDRRNFVGQERSDGEMMGCYWNGDPWKHVGSTLIDINNSGWIIGEDGTEKILWRGEERTALEMFTEVHDLNQRGQVVGEGGGSALLWENGKTYALPVPDANVTSALAINDRGWIIGMADDRPVLWRNKTVCYLDAPLKQTTDWQHIRLIAINNRGTILGAGSYKGSENERGFLLKVR